jgi:ADP-ribose pyrophosphatase YjhB (NUDIX family)
MKFCTECGSPLEFRIPDGDGLPRHICTACGKVHYVNPLVVVGCVPEYGERILLCKRAIEPRYGYWTIPAGFMEIGETLAEGAMRETMEEALARVDIHDLFAVVDVVHAKQVHLMFRATLLDGEFGAGDESLDAQLFLPDEIPWDDIAFLSVRFALEKFLEDRAAGTRRLHTKVIDRNRPA